MAVNGQQRFAAVAEGATCNSFDDRQGQLRDERPADDRRIGRTQGWIPERDATMVRRFAKTVPLCSPSRTWPSGRSPNETVSPFCRIHVQRTRLTASPRFEWGNRRAVLQNLAKPAWAPIPATPFGARRHTRHLLATAYHGADVTRWRYSAS